MISSKKAKKGLSLLRNKKGLFYIIVSSMIIIVLTVIFVAYKEYSYADRQKVIETRIMTINDFIKDIDSDSQRAMYISGFRSLIALEDYVARSGNYLDDSEELFRMAFYNGTVNNTQADVLINSSYSEYLERVKVVAEKIGLSLFINVTQITLYHESPWSIVVVATADIEINDTRGAARWEFSRDYNTSISIINIRDPVYSVGTYGRVPNTIRMNDSIDRNDFVDEDNNNDTSLLMYFINNSYYIENTLAPSFLMRLEGNFSPDPNGHGIESFVYVPFLIDQGVDYSTTKSVIDYILFNNISGYDSRRCNIDNMPSWFTIDTNHSADYEINKLTSSPC
ncbi:hypothetical protein JXB28_00090 [Candidatus Woesearchaeota archaeon]|nr:hypothetical protein [Candidatus Woesearchaeota archaeon]